MSLKAADVSLLRQFDLGLRKGMQEIGFKKSKLGRLFSMRINEETQGIVIVGLTGNVITTCRVSISVGVLNDRVEVMHRQAQAAVNYPAWMKKSVAEIKPTIRTELYRLIPAEKLQRPFISGMYERDSERSHWTFRHEDKLEPILAHLLGGIRLYALPFMESLIDCRKIYEAFVTGRVWFSPIERTSICDNPFVLFFSGREQEAYEMIERRLQENIHSLELPRQPNSMSEDGRAMTIFPSKDMLALDVQYDRAVLRGFDNLSSNKVIMQPKEA